MTGIVDIAIVMALCFAAWGLFYAGLYRTFGIDYTHHFLVTTAYFACVGAVLLVPFWGFFVPVLADFSAMPLYVLAIFMTAQLVLYLLIPRYLAEPSAYFERYPDRYFLRIHWKRIISKSADIAAQQVFIVLLVVLLQREGLTLHEILFAFGALFMLLHVPLIASERGAWPSWLFAGIVVAFSVIFPSLILLVPYGFVYNIMLHWLFYTTTGVVFWVQYDRSCLSA